MTHLSTCIRRKVWPKTQHETRPQKVLPQILFSLTIAAIQQKKLCRPMQNAWSKSKIIRMRKLRTQEILPPLIIQISKNWVHDNK